MGLVNKTRGGDIVALSPTDQSGRLSGVNKTYKLLLALVHTKSEDLSALKLAIVSRQARPREVAPEFLKQVTIRTLHLPLSDYPSVDASLLQANGIKLNEIGHSCVR